MKKTIKSGESFTHTGFPNSGPYKYLFNKERCNQRAYAEIETLIKNGWLDSFDLLIDGQRQYPLVWHVEFDDHRRSFKPTTDKIFCSNINPDEKTVIMYREEGSEDDFCSMIRFVFNKTKMKYLGIFELKNKEENVMHHGRTCTKYTFKLLQKETTYHFEYGPRWAKDND